MVNARPDRIGTVLDQIIIEVSALANDKADQVRTTLDQAGRKVEDGRGGRVGRVQPSSGMANKEFDGAIEGLTSVDLTDNNVRCCRSTTTTPTAGSPSSPPPILLQRLSNVLNAL